MARKHVPQHELKSVSHSGQVKGSLRKRIRQRINRLNLERDAALCGMTVVELRQTRQQEVNKIVQAWHAKNAQMVAEAAFREKQNRERRWSLGYSYYG